MQNASKVAIFALLLVSTAEARNPGGAAAPLLAGPCTGLGAVGVWQDVSPSSFHNPSNIEVEAVAVDHSHAGTVYAAGSNFTNGGGGPDGATATGLYKSTDCGNTWSRVSTGTNSASINGGMLWSIKVDFNNTRNIYVASGYNTVGALTIFKSTNGGVDWTDMLGNGKLLTVAGSPGGTQLTLTQVVNNSFVQAIGMDLSDSTHLVLTFHNNCFNNGANWGKINTSDAGVQCLAETLNGGTSWRFFAGPTPSSGWQEASSMTVLNHTTYVLTTATGSYYTADSGSTWQSLPFGATLGGYSAGGYLAPNGKLYMGVINSGVWQSSGSPLGSPSTWSLISGSPSVGASAITSDGTTLYTSFFNDFSGQPFYSAPLSDITSWTHMSDPTSPGHGGNALETDLTNHLVYSATGAGGVRRLRTQ